MLLRSFSFALVTGVLFGASACGPQRLPAFANPPPEDAATHDAASDDVDSGSDSDG